MRAKFVKLSAALLATTGLGVGAAELAANVEAQLQARRLLATHDGLTIGDVAAEAFSGRVTLRNVRAGRGPWRVTIGAITLPRRRPGLGLVSEAIASPFDDEPSAPQPSPAPGPAEKAMPSPSAGELAAPKPAAPPPKAASVAGTASAENVTIKSGMTTYRIARIDLTGTSMSNADVASLLDQSSPEPVEARLKKLNATAIVAPEIVADDETAGSERHAVVRQLALSGVVAGRATAANVDGISWTAKTGDDTVAGTTGAIKAVGIDLPQLARISARTRSDASEPMQPLYDSVAVSAVDVKGAKGGFSLASMKETNVKGRPLKSDFLAAGRPGKTKLSDAEQAALFDDLVHSFEVGSIELGDLVGHGTDDKGEQTVRLASFSIHDFAQSKIGGIGLRGFAVAGPGLKVSLGSLETGAFQVPAPKTTTPSTDTARAMLPTTIKVDLNALDVDAAPKDDKAGNRFQLKVAHAGLDSEGDADDIPRRSKLTIDNVAFDVPPGNDKAQPLIDMGYGHLDLSLGMVTTYDAAKQELRLRDLTLKGVNMGSFGVGLQLVNVTKGIVSPNKEIAKASAIAILVKGLSLDFVNEGLVDRVFEWKAKQDGMSVADEKAFVVDLFTNKLPASINSANVKVIGDAVAKFVQNPKTLHIEILSQNGLGVGAMSMLDDPALLLDTLDIKATANR